MITFYNKYAGSGKYSQNGEWGIILECLERIQPTILTAVEFGAPDFYFSSNLAQLEDFGWTVQMYDIDNNIDARIKQATITPENINEIIGEPTVLSIDIDGQDYHIWKAYKYRPAIVIIEINSSIPPGVEEIPGDRGASFQSMVKLGIEKDYMLIAHTGNLIFVDKKYDSLFPEFNFIDPLQYPGLYFKTDWIC